MTTNAPALADVIQRAQHETLGIPIEPAAAALAARWHRTLPAAGGDKEAPRGPVLGSHYVFGEVPDLPRRGASVVRTRRPISEAETFHVLQLMGILYVIVQNMDAVITG